MDRKELRKSKKKRKRNRIILISLSLLLVLISFGGYLFFRTYQAANETYDDLGRDKSELRQKEVSISDDPVSILLMGVENYSSGDQSGRSDTLMVATFNPKDEHLKLLSIPRDTRVVIPDRDGKDKINHAFAFGGKELTIQTVERFLNIPIDYYATVNFDGLKSIVDTVGGITVDVPFDFKQNSDDRVAEKLQFYEGEMELNGRYALAYARMRLEDPRGDIGRNERQKQVVEAIIEELISASTIMKIDNLAKDLESNLETNMKLREAVAFFRRYSDFRVSNIDQITLEGESQYINSLSYYIPTEESLNEVKNELRNHLELESDGNMTEE
ncbi:putative transcriptional regulator YvhJ [Paraliobacillus quinghaiensis]|uniref:Transcriptional regulator YvhJ n=1 Tax=Paraliobacillus quinghaiensis TaxID=470815 RepID=A0A917TPR2_9BACI|nr:LCP family protein [Paraliobacillus quinghaiensis]GGM32258.1 putative transcriptional regulator YvhJ [Paraliobacillus quinghaiensis]